MWYVVFINRFFLRFCVVFFFMILEYNCLVTVISESTTTDLRTNHIMKRMNFKHWRFWMMENENTLFTLNLSNSISNIYLALCVVWALAHTLSLFNRKARETFASIGEILKRFQGFIPSIPILRSSTGTAGTYLYLKFYHHYPYSSWRRMLKLWMSWVKGKYSTWIFNFPTYV